MKYKLSNTASIKELEEFTGLPLKHPNVYAKSPIITGFQEAITPVITENNPKEIEFGIWGLLPDNFNEDWEVFQNAIDTLTINPSNIDEDILFNESLNLKKCVVAVTGFFTSYLHNGKIYPYYVYSENKDPFFLAAYYNTLTDGFITFSIVLNTVDSNIKKIQNLSKLTPKVLSSADKDIWLNKNFSKLELTEFIDKPTGVSLKSHTISKDLFNMGISYYSMFDEVKYSELIQK